MSFEIPDVKEFNPKPESVATSECNECDCPPSCLDSKYLQLKEKVVTSMKSFEDPSKNMVHVQLTDLPSAKLIKEIESKNCIVKYEVTYDGKDIIGNIRIYRPGYVPSNMGEVFDVFRTSVPVETELSDKFKTVMEKFMQL